MLKLISATISRTPALLTRSGFATVLCNDMPYKLICCVVVAIVTVSANLAQACETPHHSTTEAEKVKIQPSSRLSPKAKKAFLKSDPETQIIGLAQLAFGADIEDIRVQVRALGGTTGAWNSTTHQLSMTLPAGRLNAFADISAVVYFEAAEPYSP